MWFQWNPSFGKWLMDAATSCMLSHFEWCCRSATAMNLFHMLEYFRDLKYHSSLALVDKCTDDPEIEATLTNKTNGALDKADFDFIELAYLKNVGIELRIFFLAHGFVDSCCKIQQIIAYFCLVWSILLYTTVPANTVQSCNCLFDSHPVAVLMFDRTGTQCTTPKGWKIGWAMCSRSSLIEYWHPLGTRTRNLWESGSRVVTTILPLHTNY